VTTQVVVTVWTTCQTCHVIAVRHCHPSLPFIRWAGDVLREVVGGGGNGDELEVVAVMVVWW